MQRDPDQPQHGLLLPPLVETQSAQQPWSHSPLHISQATCCSQSSLAVSVGTQQLPSILAHTQKLAPQTFSN